MQLSNDTINILKKKQSRNEYLDWLKGFAIFLVVFGHCTIESSTFWLIYRFHMPLFFCISGYLFKNTKKFKDFFISKLKTLIIPYIVFFITSYIIATLFLNLDMSIIEMLKYLFLNGKFCASVTNFALWYLPLFFVASNIFYFITKLKNKYLFICILILFGICIVPFNNILFTYFTNECIPFSIQVLPASLLFMGFGYIYNQIHLTNFVKKLVNNKKVFIIFVLLFIAGIMLSFNLYDQIIHITSYKYIFTAILVLPLIVYCTYGNTNKLIVYLGKISLLILGLHRILIGLFEYYNWVEFFNTLNVNLNISALILTIFVISIICIINELYIFLKKQCIKTFKKYRP